MDDEHLTLRQALGPRYELGAELGRGGMATVYRARDLKHLRPVAVKVFDPAVGSVIGIKRFQSEIAIAASLQHPAIVPLYDSGVAGEQLYYIMPLVEGESLRDRLVRETQLPLPDSLQILRDVANALDYAHAHGVVHRDIKPENILLSGAHALVADFGIARALGPAGGERLTDSSLAIGTPAYMSPEQVGGGQIDGRSDVYSLGCVLYEMLAGEPPFTGRTAQSIFARQLHERPPSLQVVRSTIPLAMQQAVERALAKLPADRFTSATQFADVVSAAHTAGTSGKAVAMRPTTWTARRTILALALAGVTGIAGWLFTHRAPAADPNRVVVFPFSAPGHAASEGIGEQVALMIGSALEHTEPLTWLDGQALLPASANAGAPPSASEAASAARAAGARYYLVGHVVGPGDSLTVIVRLGDAVSDSLVRQESATGAASATTAPRLALRAIALILPHLLPPNGRVDLSYLADRNPAAIADWLQGEREFARSQYKAAKTHMDRALEKDSAMGVAALKGAQAAAYREDYVAARSLIDIAINLDRQLPRHQVAFARGLRFFLTGAADSAVAAFRVAHAADTTWSEPQMWLGETYAMLMPSAVGLDSLAEQVFAGVVERNAKFAPALYALAATAALRGDAQRADSLADAFRSAKPDSDWVFQLELTVRCAAHGPDGVDWPAAVRRASDRVVNVARVLGAGARFPECSRRAQEAVLAFDTDTSVEHRTNRWSALKGLSYQAMAEGRDSAVVALLDSARAHGMREAVSLHVLNAAAGSRPAAARADSAMAELAVPIERMNAVRLRYFALWEFSRGNGARLDSIARRSRFVADSTGSGADRLMADCVAARLAVLRHDTTTAIQLLQGLRMASDPGLFTWNPWQAAASERLLLAQLLLAKRRPKDAIDVAALFDSPRTQIHLLYLHASLEVRMRAAEQMGSVGERERYEKRLAALGRSGVRQPLVSPAGSRPAPR